MTTITPDYSVIIPVYFNEGLLKQTMTALREQVLNTTSDHTGEVIFVDDGSGDGSLQELIQLRDEDPVRIKVIKLTRNFGQVNALRAGFAHAAGRCVVAMSADGQDPVALIKDMLAAHFSDGCEVVVCSREGRDESYYRVITSKLFYMLMRKLSFPNMPPGGFDFLLLGRRALETLLRMQEAQPFFQGQILWMGYPIRFISYQRQKRLVGQSRWTFSKKLTYLIDGVMSYSFLPIRMVSLAGLLVALMGFAYALVVFAFKLIGGHAVKGWTPLMIVILVLGGFQMLTLGIFGEYMWRILAHVQRREPYIIDRTYGWEPDGFCPPVK